MSRQAAPVEINKFIGGLNTDASPLSPTPETGMFALEMENYILNIDGSIRRRLGLDYETGWQSVSTNKAGDVVFNSFKWENAGGAPENNILVVQIGRLLKFFLLNGGETVSNKLIFTHELGFTTDSTTFSFCVADGVLVVASNEPYPIFYEYKNGTITFSAGVTLKIRDFFGVEDKINGFDLYGGSGVQARPTVLTNPHLYNLRNQSWGISRIDGENSSDGTPAPNDPVNIFAVPHAALNKPGGTFPSNSDTTTPFVYADPENASNRTINRFWATDAVNNPLGNTKAPNGYFIIDALNRGASRLAQEAANRGIYPALNNHIVSVLPEDRTPGGPTVVAEFAGRVFYAGFSGEVIGGDTLSPRMSSYVLFSQVAHSVNDMTLCYPAGDPTSMESPDTVDTDGGFVRINGAFGIKKMVNLGSSLMIIAQNGVWRIMGTDDNGFTATRYIVEKVSDRGCTSPGSVIVIENTVAYWGDDGIYHARQDQFGAWGVQDMTVGKIEKFFKNLSTDEKRNVQGSYDSFDGKVRWLINTKLSNTKEVIELVYDPMFQAFYTNRIKKANSLQYPKVMGYYKGIAYSDLQGEGLKEVGYVVATGNNNISFTFAKYKNPLFKDWNLVDASAYTVTSYLSAGDFQRDKSIPYLTIFLNKTETGFQEVNGDIVPVNPSSCIIQSLWEWANSANSGKWGRPFQAYRHGRVWFPANVASKFDNGDSLVVTKNKLRGNGRVLSVKFSTEPEKDFHLFGWSLIMSVAGNV